MEDKLNRTQYIAKKIIELRESVNWSQSELARQTGITSAAISQIEKGDRMPSFEVMRKLAHAFKISISDLTGDSDATSVGYDEIKIFFRKFGDIKNLNEEDQKIIQSLIERFKHKTHEKNK